MLTFAEVRALALALPEATEGASYGTPAFKVRGKLFARLRDDGDILVVKVDGDLRDALIQITPDIYFITPHYEAWYSEAWRYVLVRLPNIDHDELRERLNESWQMSAPKRLHTAFAAGANSKPVPHDRADDTLPLPEK